MKELKIEDMSFADIKVHFKDGGSTILNFKEFQKLVKAASDNCRWHFLEDEPLENQKVIFGMIDIDSIKYTEIAIPE